LKGGTNFIGFVFGIAPTVEYGFETDFLETGLEYMVFLTGDY